MKIYQEVGTASIDLLVRECQKAHYMSVHNIFNLTHQPCTGGSEGDKWCP